jgi:ribosomal-protein-alanine N-acetyltransferase
MTAAPVLATDRLFLRDWREEDLAPFAALNADPRVMEFFPTTLDRAESDALAARLQGSIEESGFGFWAAERKEDGAFVGFVGLRRPRFMPAVEIGWRLARAYWGKGYATEAARAALAHGFGPLGLSEIVAFTVPTNRRSRSVMERLGMAHDPGADFDHPAVPEGHALRRHVLYRLAREKWNARGDTSWRNCFGV